MIILLLQTRGSARMWQTDTELPLWVQMSQPGLDGFCCGWELVAEWREKRNVTGRGRQIDGREVVCVSVGFPPF